MLIVFEVHLHESADPNKLLSADILRDTQAQIMTVAEAKKVGFGGLPDLGPNVRLIAVAKRDSNWIYRTLETSNEVAAFKMHEVDA
ncbi:MAG TPA: hypothetical protein VL400_22125 [Polyangiaceae bacterium]|jgi:hypothetical protein|nr:hypothetical protein [Polyangiaceae bacterium]